MKFLLILAGTLAFSAVGYSADAPTAATEPAPDRLAEAQILMQNMRFRDSMMKVLDIRKEVMSKMIDQSTTKMAPGSASADEIADYKKQMIDAWWAQMNPDQILEDMTKVYANLFSTDELRAIADFYQSPGGQALVAKTLELQQKSGSILTTRMAASMPVLQKLQKSFFDAHPAKAAGTPVANSTIPRISIP